jgi:tetratricopeptide (TPR) repeat protein
MDRVSLLQEADHLVAEGKLPLALAAYQKLRRAFPEDQGIMNRLGDLLVQAGSVAEAATIFKVLALNLQRDGHEKKAVAQLRKVLRFAPHDAEAAGQLAELLIQGGQTKEAMQLHQQVAKEMAKRGRPDEALAALSRAVATDPTDLRVRFDLAQAYVQASQKDKAAGLYLDCADALLHARRLAEAGEALELAEALGPSAKLALTQARFHLLQGHPPKAVHVLKESLKRWPGNAVLTESLAGAQMEAGHPKSCLEALGHLRQPSTKVLPLSERALRAIIAERKLSQALQLFRPIAESLGQRGHAHEACQTLAKAAEGFEHPILKVFIGEIFQVADRKEEAIKAFNDALALAQLQKTSTLRNKIRNLLEDIAKSGAPTPNSSR